MFDRPTRAYDCSLANIVASDQPALAYAAAPEERESTISSPLGSTSRKWAFVTSRLSKGRPDAVGPSLAETLNPLPSPLLRSCGR